MNDRLPVCGFERVCNLPCKRQGFSEPHRTSGKAIRERWSFHQLHHEGATTVRPFEAIDLRDIGMVQGGERFGLTLEARQALRIMGEGVG
jgi:hypothetical protein